ncbi:MAG: [FeFe] hydrogenase H-cluster maturation GTPase HydF [Bacteroidota bacterium]
MKKTRENKPHIGIFGRRNYGKSSLLNALADQDISIVSPVAGTTTDPVKKSVEIAGIGPSIIIDTAGMDDIGDLGTMRVAKSLDALKQIDLAVLLISNNTFDAPEKKLIDRFYEYGVPFFIIHNKADLHPLDPVLLKQLSEAYKTDVVDFTLVKSTGIQKIINLLVKHMPETAYTKPTLLGNLVSYGDVVMLVTPIDIEAPEGRLILPQVQAIRDVLDNDCIAVVVKEREVDVFLRKTGIEPALVVTDSSLFLKVEASIPKHIPLTGFSVLLAHFKGDFPVYLDGTLHIDKLKDGDRVLMLESCSHHVSCDDIGRVKIPRWISQFTGKKLEFDTIAGLNNLTRPVEDYALVIQCGGCVVTRKQLVNRLKPAKDAHIPITNYGLAIAYVQGVYNRVVAPFTRNFEGEDYL